jgi:hypothetical protein
MAVPSATERSADAPSDAGRAPTAPDDADLAPPRAAVAAQVFSACRETRVVGCDALYVRMLASHPDLCVQLAMDNCIVNDRQGLPVTLPLAWRMSSGSASGDRGCDLRDYDPKSEPVLTARGKITWAQRLREISGVEIDIQLRLEPPPASELPADIAVKTEVPIAVVEDCEN